MDLNEIITQAKSKVGEADIAERYYNGQHDILNNKIVYVSDNGRTVEDQYSSNIRISHPFFTELVQQSTNNIFNEPVKFITEHTLLDTLLQEYITNDVHEMLYEVVEEASKKGWEWVYAYMDDEGMPGFQIIDGRQVADVVDEYGNTTAVVRFYDDVVQVWDKDNYYDYEANKDGDYVAINTVPHDTPGRIPWYKLKNNRQETSDLKLIKPFIDDYDIMSSYSSNDLQDFRGNIYVLKGGQGEDLSRLKANVSSIGAVKVGANQDVNVETNVVSIDSRLKKMEIDKQNIYQIGQGFDDTTIANSSGSVTNEMLKAGQRKLIQKSKGKVKYLKGLIDWLLQLILDDIAKKGLGEFTLRDIDVEFTFDVIEDDKTVADVELVHEQRKMTAIQAILLVEHILDEGTVLELVSNVLGINSEEVAEDVLTQDYAQLVGDE